MCFIQSWSGEVEADVGDRPAYLSYGSFGHVAAHELTVRLSFGCYSLSMLMDVIVARV